MNSHATHSVANHVRTALLALVAAFALLMALAAGNARAAYTDGTDIVTDAATTSVAVNQTSQDLYVANVGNNSGFPFFGPSGTMARFSSAGADLGCAATFPTTPARPASVAVEPTTNNIFVLDDQTNRLNTRLHTFDATCASRVGTEFAVVTSTSRSIAQPAVGPDGNLYMPNAESGALEVFMPDGTPVALDNPITGIANLSAVAFDSDGDVYVVEPYLTASAGTKEAQGVSFTGTPTAGTFTLTFDGETTDPISYSATISTLRNNIRAQMQALPNVADSDVNVTGNPAVVTFQNGLAGTNLPEMTCDGANLTPGGAACAVATTAEGAPGADTSVHRFAPDGTPEGDAFTGQVTSLAIDRSNDETFVGVRAGSTHHIAKYSPGGAELTEFGADQFTFPTTVTTAFHQLAVDETSGRVYAVDTSGFKVQVFEAPTKFDLDIDTDDGAGTGIVTCDLGAGDEPDCPQVDGYDDGTVVTLSADADNGSVFAGWSGEGCSGTGTCQVTMSAAKAVTATFDIAPPPVVTSLAPDHGPAAGGNSVVITGTEFTDATGVKFGANSATGVTVDSDTQITATAPAGTRGTTVQVEVTGPGGASADVAGDDYDYDLDAPAITGLSPDHGPAAGGTVVTITGTDFTGATQVRFGTNSATGVTVDSSTQITATAPAGTRGTTVGASVETPSGTSTDTAADDYDYDLDAPAITSIAPDHGPAAGGNSVVITGTDLTGATQVSFGASAVACPGANCTVDSSTQITANAPPGTRGTTVDVSVETPSGTSADVAADDYDYDLDNHALTINGGGNGTGSVTCDGGACAATYVEGTTVTLSATADPGSTFTGWSGGGCSGTADCDVTVNDATTVTATFTLNDTDGDGVPDNTDACPTVAAATANGCPAPVIIPDPDPVPIPDPIPGMPKVANVALVKGNKAALKIACSGGGACSGVLKLFAKVKKGKKTKNVLAGKARYKVAAGQRKTVKVKISNGLVKKLLKRGKTVKAVLKGKGLKGSVKLKPAKKNKRHKRGGRR